MQFIGFAALAVIGIIMMRCVVDYLTDVRRRAQIDNPNMVAVGDNAIALAVIVIFIAGAVIYFVTKYA